MPYLGDSRHHLGPGIVPAQDHRPESRVPLAHRSALLATRIIGRDDSTGQLGHHRYARETLGDVIGAMLWPHSGAGAAHVAGGASERKTPAWSWIYPSVTLAQSVGIGEGRTSAAAVGASSGNAGAAAGSGGILAEKNMFPGGAGPTSVASKPIFGPSGQILAGNQVSPFGIFPGGKLFNLSKPDNRLVGVGAVAGAGGGGGGGGGQGAAAAQAWFGHGGEDQRVPTDVLPTRTLAWSPDGRFRKMRMGSPLGWPDFASGWHGVTVMGTDERSQVEFWHPTDPRLVAPNISGPRTTASLVCDIQERGSGPDIERHARISGFWRVIRGPKNAPGHRNALAWQLWISGQDDVRGGYVYDKSMAPRVTTITPGSHKSPTTRNGKLELVSSLEGQLTTNALGQNALSGPGGISSGVASGGGGNIVSPADSSLVSRPTTGPGSISVAAQARSRGARGSTGPVIGMASYNDRGPLTPGLLRDPHRVAFDADGTPINPVHLQTGALWINPRNTSEDGPMRLESYQQGEDLDYIVPVHYGFDPATREFAWWTTSEFGWPPESPPPGPPGPQPPKDRPDPPVTPRPDPRPDEPRGPITPGGRGHGGPATPGGGPQGATGPEGGGGPAGGPGILRPTPSALIGARDPRLNRPCPYTVHEVGVPSISFRPQRMRTGQPDLRYSRHAPHNEFAAHDLTAPVVLRLESFGAQGGRQDGPYLGGFSGGTRAGAGLLWDYTQKPGASRSRGGTADGGLWAMRPETDLSDIDKALAPSGGDLSTAYFGIGPGVGLAFGLPNLATGGANSGKSLRGSSGDLIIASHDGDSARTDIATITTAALQLSALFLEHGSEVGITASTTQSQGQQPLTKGMNQVSVVANVNDVVTLPAAAAGRMVYVVNDGANALQVFPASGHQVDGGAADASVTLAADERGYFGGISATGWRSMVGVKA